MYSRAGLSVHGHAERERPRTAQSFCVPKDDIASWGYDLSLNRYKEVVHEEVEHRPHAGDPRGGEGRGKRGSWRSWRTRSSERMKELEGMLG